MILDSVMIYHCPHLLQSSNQQQLLNQVPVKEWSIPVKLEVSDPYLESNLI